MPKTPDIIKEASKKLRKNMTESEKALWREIMCEKLGIKFLRQKPLYVYTEDNGLDRFLILDFISLGEKIIIEVDGNVHDINEVLILDKEKEKLAVQIGYRVIRFANTEIINNLEEVVKELKVFINS